MTSYRADVQYGIPLLEAPLGFYWCTEVWYFNTDGGVDYATGREGAIRLTSEGLNVNVIIWDLLVVEWPSKVFVEHSHPTWDHPVLSGPYDPPQLTVYVSLLNAGRQVSYKRVRSPLRHEDYTADMLLTDTALAYYQGVFDLVADYGCFTNANGVPIETARVHPAVMNWQLRHGTRRRWQRRIA